MAYFVRILGLTTGHLRNISTTNKMPQSFAEIISINAIASTHTLGQAFSLEGKSREREIIDRRV